MVSICATTFDLAGALNVRKPGEHRFREFEPRQSRVKLVDGSSEILSSGYVAGDRSLVLDVSGLSLTDRKAIERMIKIHIELSVSIDDSFFIVAPGKISFDSWDLLVKEEL